MENKFYNISKCCNSHSWNLPQSVHDVLLNKPIITFCTGCGKQCESELKPAFLKKAQGIYSKIEYNKKRL